MQNDVKLNLRINENRLVLCDDFFQGVLRMENIQVVDIKTAIMPCVCELKNLTELANIGWVMDFGSECLKPSDRMTSTAIGAVNISPDIKYSFNRKAMPAELREKCSVPSGETKIIGVNKITLTYLAPSTP